MDAIDWTRPDAYGDGTEDDLDAAVATCAARHMYRAFDAMAAPLDRAAWRTRSPAVRADIEAATAAMTAAAATQDALLGILATADAVSLGWALSDVWRAIGIGTRHRAPPPAPDFGADVLAACAKPATAWAIAAAVVEMADEVGGTRGATLDAKFVDGHLAVVVGGAIARRRSRRTGRTPKPGAAEPEARNPFLDRLADLLSGRVVRGVHGRGRGIALVIKVRLHDAPPGGAR